MERMELDHQKDKSGRRIENIKQHFIVPLQSLSPIILYNKESKIMRQILETFIP